MSVRKKGIRLRKDAAICYHLRGVRGLFAFVANLLLGYPECVIATPAEVRHPLFLRLRTSDAKVYRDIFLGREYDYPISFSPRTIVDAGANCGITTVFYANRYPEATVVAVEPEASNYMALVRNTRSYPNVITVQAALWKEDGQVEIFAGDEGFSGWPRMKSWGKWGFHGREGSGCRAVTLPTLMREVGIETVDILKVDVEGAEREIFSESAGLDYVKLLAIELHDRSYPGCSDAVNAAAKRHLRTERGLVTFYSR
jgi:FkbM family methyltransferase